MFYCVLVLYLAFSIKYQFLCDRCSLYRVYTRQDSKVLPVWCKVWSHFHPEYHASALALCGGDSCIHILSSIPIGRNKGLSGHVIPDT
jgi:hypothetical protein